MLQRGHTLDELPDGTGDVDIARVAENTDASIQAPKRYQRVTQSLDVRGRRNLRLGVVIYVHELQTN
jgi:hypothetical protein